MKTISPSPEFLDSLGKVYQVKTDKADRIVFESESFGCFIGFDTDRSELTQIKSVENWIKDQNLRIKDTEYLGYFAVRDIFTKELKMNIDDDEGSIDVWLNIVLPCGEPLDRSIIRVEAYTSQQQALDDAEQELDSSIYVSRVLTRPVRVNFK